MTDRPDILYVANMRLPSEKAHSVHVMEMCAALAANRARVTLLVPDRKTDIGSDPFEYYGVPHSFEILRLPTVDAFRMPIPRCAAFLIQSWFFARSVAQEARCHPDAVILSRDLASTARLARHGRMVAFEVHDLPGGRARQIIRSIPWIITTNRWKRDELVRMGIDASRILVAPNAVDAAKFETATAGILHQELGWPADRKIVLYTGHLFAWKGVETFARAAAILGDEVSVVIVGGTAHDSARLRGTIEREKLPVTLLGHRPHNQMPAILASASVVVLPTSAKFSIGRVETSPIKAFEYLAAKKPIVASDVPSSREVFDDSTAFFFKPDDPQDCARAIREALGNPHAKEAAQSAYIKAHTWEARARTILEFLKTD